MKVGLLLSHALHERNLVASGLAQKIADKHELVILRPKEIGAVGGPWRRRVREAFVLASMVAREPGSRTYAFKLAQRRPLAPRLEIRAFRILRDRGVDLEDAWRRWEARQRPPWAALQATTGLDALLWPTLIHQHNEEVELVKSARQGQKCRIVAAPASWDSLTSKGAFLVQPDAMLVWGEASKRHAVQWHGMTAGQVTVTGPPHFDFYHEPRRVMPTRPSDAPILVAGTSVHYWQDELAMVAFLRSRLNGVVHRPHPRRGGGWTWAAMEELRHQLDCAVCVVAAFSTVVIEAALMGLPSLLVGFAQSTHGPAMAGYHFHLEHMAEIARWSGVHLCRDPEELVHECRAYLHGKCADEAALRIAALEVARSDGHAQERILEALDSWA